MDKLRKSKTKDCLQYKERYNLKRFKKFRIGFMLLNLLRILLDTLLSVLDILSLNVELIAKL
jgi:hypothetical protein